MPHAQSSMLIAGSALLVGALGLAYTYNSGSHGRPSSLTDIDEDDEQDFITEQDVCKIFDKLFMELQSVFSQLMQQIQQLQMAGQRIPEAQLKSILREEMVRALTVKQKMVLEQFDIEYDCLEEATWEFLGKEEEYPSVKRSVERFQKLWENATGEEVVGWRPGKDASRMVEDLLGPEQTIEMADKYFSALTEAMRDLVERYQAEGADLKDPSVQQAMNMEFARNANDYGEAALREHGVSMTQFESSVKANSGNPNVGRSLAQLQMKQQQELMAIGAGQM
jgi:hypothetical protein